MHTAERPALPQATGGSGRAAMLVSPFPAGQAAGRQDTPLAGRLGCAAVGSGNPTVRLGEETPGRQLERVVGEESNGSGSARVASSLPVPPMPPRRATAPPAAMAFHPRGADPPPARHPLADRAGCAGLGERSGNLAGGNRAEREEQKSEPLGGLDSPLSVPPRRRIRIHRKGGKTRLPAGPKSGPKRPEIQHRQPLSGFLYEKAGERHVPTNSQEVTEHFPAKFARPSISKIPQDADFPLSRSTFSGGCLLESAALLRSRAWLPFLAVQNRRHPNLLHPKRCMPDGQSGDRLLTG